MCVREGGGGREKGTSREGHTGAAPPPRRIGAPAVRKGQVRSYHYRTSRISFERCEPRGERDAAVVHMVPVGAVVQAEVVRRAHAAHERIVATKGVNKALQNAMALVGNVVQKVV